VRILNNGCGNIVVGRMHDLKKILIIETAFIGDAVLSLALAEEIKRLQPDIQIDYLVIPSVAELIRCSPSVTKVHVFDKRGSDSGEDGIIRRAEALNMESYDAVFCLHESHRTAKLLSRLKAKVKVGNSNAKNLHPYLTHSYTMPTKGRRTERITTLASYFSDSYSTNTLPKLVFQGELPHWIKEMGKYVAIAPGSAWKTKKWLTERFQASATQIHEKGYGVVVVGTSDDYEAGSAILNGIPSSHAINTAGKLSLVETGRVISYGELLIGNDSAPIHIATACQVPTVEILGPTVTDFGFIPPVTLGKVVEITDLWCRPCNSHGGEECPIHTHECMTGIQPDQVVSAALEILG
jgi:heptosyltransferase II